ncbi:hypothetical protein FRC03_004424 [Tulasnella sp. 419]|nr:hypothetical protein FRC03_004424 [Tulasnella sp. 419]
MGFPLDSLTIKPANAKQTRISREATFNEWNRGLTLEQYINREVRLEQCDFAADGNLTTWVLVPRENLETDDILCSCETYRRKVAVKDNDETNLKFAIGYGIASVYTREHLRSNGYAGHMMKLLHWVLGAKDSFPPFPQG